MRRGICCLLSAALILGGCGAAERAEMPTTEAVTVENISVENYFETGVNRETFTSVPQRIVIIGANESETLLDLGVTDGIVSVTPSQNNPTYGIKACNQATFDALPQLGRAEINTERLLALAPDLIVAQQEFFSKNRLGSTAYWNERGTATMVPLNTTAPGKLNQRETIEREMKFIRDLGTIFHRERAAERIVDDTYARIDFIRTQTEGGTPPKVMVLDLISIIASYGRDKIAGDMVSAIGGDIPHTSAAVTAEQIMAENPDVVFLVSYGDDEGQLAKIRSNPAFRNLNFIRDGRLYPIPLKFVYGPQTRTIDAIGYMANYMYPGLFDFAPEYDFGVQSLKE